MQFTGLYKYFIKLHYPAVRRRCLCCKSYNKQLVRGYSDKNRTLQYKVCAVKWKWENVYIHLHQMAVILALESFENLWRKSLFGCPLKVRSGTTTPKCRVPQVNLKSHANCLWYDLKSSPHLHLPSKRISSMWSSSCTGMPCTNDFFKSIR